MYRRLVFALAVLAASGVAAEETWVSKRFGKVASFTPGAPDKAAKGQARPAGKRAHARGPRHDRRHFDPRRQRNAVVDRRRARLAALERTDGGETQGQLPRVDGPRSATQPRGRANAEKRPVLPPASGRNAKWAWRITKETWSADDERKFESFITKIGESDCKTVHECMTSSIANPMYHTANPPHYQFFADCADLPYFLRAYFAWRNELPFSFSIRYGSHPRAAGNNSNVLGNQITERYDIVGPGPDARLALANVGRFVSSEHFRTPPLYTGKLPTDHYPAALTRESIRPGTVIFDPDGHVAVVFKVTEDGRVHYIDSHPDNSLTRGIYNREFARAMPEMGAGFRRFRPQRLQGATRSKDGLLTGGRIVLAANEELRDWSIEQYYGNQPERPALWSDGKFLIDGKEHDYYDYLRLRLAYPGFKYDPIDEVRQSVRQICRDLQYRVTAVDAAIAAGIAKRPQPARLPNNIYATTGMWELYSSPSRDARLKTAFQELSESFDHFVEMSKKDKQALAYVGKNLRGDMLRVYREESERCSVTYSRSNGMPKVLSYKEVQRRLFLLSFDPHHCVELRWGADDRDELSTCPDGPDKHAWYKAQQNLRNQVTRTYGEKMGWSLAELRDSKRDIGIDEMPEVAVGDDEVASSD